MKLKVCCDLQEGESLDIKVNNVFKSLYSFDNIVVFNVSDSYAIDIEIERKTEKSNRRIIDIIFFVITIFIQGIFNCIFINDNFKWYEDIIPFGFKAKISIPIIDNLLVRLKYDKSKYYGFSFDLPKLEVSNGQIEEIEYFANYNSFTNCWFSFVKRIFSIASVLLLIMGMLLIVAISNKNAIAAVIVSIILIGIIALPAFLAVMQHKKLNNILKSFDKFLKDNNIDI